MIIESMQKAFELLITFDSEIYDIIFLSLFISIFATITAAIIGVIFGIYISITPFRGKKVVKRIIFTLMGIPPVVLGLIVLLFLIGPFNQLDLLFTRTAMYIAQTLLVLPIITGNMITSSEKTQQAILETATTLGASKKEKIKLLIFEIKPFILMSITLGFSRAISEVGAVMLVGGNIKGSTRVMTTFIATSNSMGDYSLSIAVGIILLLLAFLVHTLIASIRGDLYD